MSDVRKIRTDAETEADSGVRFVGTEAGTGLQGTDGPEREKHEATDSKHVKARGATKSRVRGTRRRFDGLFQLFRWNPSRKLTFLTR